MRAIHATLCVFSLVTCLAAQGSRVTEGPEPNDLLTGTPTTLLCGDQAEGVIDPPVGLTVDRDAYTFMLTAPMDVYLATSRGGTSGFINDTVIDVFAADGTTLLFSDADSGDGLYSRLGPLRLPIGTYHVEVRPKGLDTEVGNYTLDLYCLPASAPPSPLCTGPLTPEVEAAEPNDTPATALVVDCCSTITGNIDGLGDEDWYCLVADQTLMVSANTAKAGGTLATSALRLWDSTGTELLFKVDSLDSLSAFEQRLPPSTYYISVSGGLANGTGSYCLDVTCSVPGRDLFGEPEFAVIGGGCVGSNGRTPMIIPRLGEAPRLGSVFCVDVIDLPTTATSAVVFIGFRDFAVDLGVIGAPGCTLLTSTDIIQSVPVSGGAAEFCVNIVDRAGLLGFEFNLQFAAIDFGANALGIVLSDRGDGTIGV